MLGNAPVSTFPVHRDGFVFEISELTWDITHTVENLVEYAQNERLRERFLERMQQYMGLWNHVGSHCRQYIDRISTLRNESYSFLSHSTSTFTPPRSAPEIVDMSMSPEPERAPSFD